MTKCAERTLRRTRPQAPAGGDAERFASRVFVFQPANGVVTSDAVACRTITGRPATEATAQWTDTAGKSVHKAARQFGRATTVLDTASVIFRWDEPDTATVCSPRTSPVPAATAATACERS